MLYRWMCASLTTLVCGSAALGATVTDQWKSATNGDWTTASNWVGNGQYPNNDANNACLAIIAATGSPYTVTLNTSAGVSVNSLSVTSPNATFNLAGGTLSTVNGVNFSAGTVNLNGGTFAGGTVTFGSNVTTNVNGLVGVFANLVNNGTTTISSGNELYLRFASFYNNGYLRITDNAVRARYALFATSGTEALNNTGTVVYNSNTSAYPFFPLNNNGGTLLINTGAAVFANGDVRFSGNSFVGGAGTFEYYSPSFIAGSRMYNTGTLAMTGSHTVLYGDVFNSGKITFTGPVDFGQGGLFGGGSYNLTSTASATFGASTAYDHAISGTLNNAGTLNVEAGHYIKYNIGTLNNSGTLNLLGSGTYATAMSYQGTETDPNQVTNSGTINVTGSSTIYVPFVNSGTILVNSASELWIANDASTFNGNSYVGGAGTLWVSTDNLTVQQNASVNVAPGARFMIQSAILKNSGTVQFNGGIVTTPVFYNGGTVVNYGTVAVSNGTFALDRYTQFWNDGGAIAINNGTLSLANVGIVNEVYAANPTGGRIGGNGTLQLSSSFINNTTGMTFTLAPGSVTATATSLGNYGTFIIGAPSTFTSSSLDGAGTFYINSGVPVSFNGAFNAPVVNNGTLTIPANASASFNNGGSVINNSYLNLIDGTNNFSLGPGAGTVINNGTISASAGSTSFANSIYVPLINAGGTISVNAAILQVASAATFTGSSHITGPGTMSFSGSLTKTVNSGTLDVNASTEDYSGTFTNNGTAAFHKSILHGAGLFINNGKLTADRYFFLNGGTLQNNGSFSTPDFEFNGGTLSGSSPVYATSTITIGSSSSPTLSGQLVNSGSMAVYANQPLVLASGTLTNNGTLQLNANAAASPLISSRGVLNNSGTLYLNYPGNFSAATLSIGTVPILNSGTVNVASRTLAQLNGNSPAFANGVLGSGTWIVNSVGTIDLIDGPTLTKNSAAVYLINSGGFNALNSVTQNTGTISLQNGTMFTLADGFLNTGTLDDATNNSFYFKTAGSVVNYGTLTGKLITGNSFTMAGNSLNGKIGGGTLIAAANANARIDSINSQSLAIADHARLSITAGGGTLGTTILFSGLDVSASGATLNLNDHDLVLYYTGVSPYASARDAIASGYANGAWNGPGIDSGTAAAAGKMLGVADSIDLYGTTPTLFSGQAINNPYKAVLIRYTYAGDANLDGKVDIVDLGLLAGSWHQNGGWYQGDFNYDGKIDIVDLGALAGDWHFGSAGSSMTFAKAMTLVDLGGSVPEPSVLATISLCAVLMRRRA